MASAAATAVCRQSTRRTIKTRKAKFRGRRTENSDIEDSGLPANIQSILKTIRALKEQIAQRQAELQAVMAGKSQNAEQMPMKSGNLQNVIAGLNSSLMAAYARLNKAVKGAGLGGDQLMKVASLVAKL